MRGYILGDDVLCLDSLKFPNVSETSALLNDIFEGALAGGVFDLPTTYYGDSV